MENDLIYVGMSDSKIKVFDSYGSGDTSVNIRVGSGGIFCFYFRLKREGKNWC